MSGGDGSANLPPESPDLREIYYWRNVIACSLASALWTAAYACVALETIQAVFLQRLGASKTIIGALPALVIAAFALLQVPSVRWTRRLPRKMRAFVIVHFPAALLWIVLGVLAAHWSVPHPYRMIWVLLAVAAGRGLSLGITGPLWGDLLRRLFPDNRRGQASGIISSACGLFGVLGAVYGRHILHQIEFPADFSQLFVTAGTIMLIAASLYLTAREVAPLTASASAPQPSYRSVLVTALKKDRRLRRFVFSFYVFTCGAAVAMFFAVYGLEKFAQPTEMAGTFTLLLMASGVVGSPVLGGVGDRRGYRRVLGWGMIAMMGATVMALLSPSISLFYVVFILHGIANSSGGVGMINMLIEICPHEDKSTYVALFSTVMMPVQAAAPILIGNLADRLGMVVVLAVALAVQAAGFVALIALVDDPRRPGRRILRWPPQCWLPRLT